MLSSAMMFSLLSTGLVFGGVHHIAPDDVQRHEHPAATHSKSLDSSSMLAYSFQGGAITEVSPMMLTANHSFQKRIKASYQHQPSTSIP